MARRSGAAMAALGAGLAGALMLGAFLLVRLIAAPAARPVSTAVTAADAAGGPPTVELAGGGRVLLTLPEGWHVTGRREGQVSLASSSSCHAATVSAFHDHAHQRPETRAERMLGYMAGRDYASNRLWRGTVAGGRGYAVYDPEALLGVESVRERHGSVLILIHGLAGHGGRCTPAAARRARFELSRVLQDLRLSDAGPDLATAPSG